MHVGSKINLIQWLNVVLGLIWSILGTQILSKFVNLFIKELVSKVNVKKIKKLQILSCCGMSFAHGAQDGLKFIGLMYIYINIVTGNIVFEKEMLIMLICALTMGLGVLIGGKRIVTTVGEKMIKLENSEAFCSDVSTILTLLIK